MLLEIKSTKFLTIILFYSIDKIWNKNKILVRVYLFVYAIISRRSRVNDE